MIFGIFTLLVALSLAGVAAWFSIVGLMAIFSASASSVAIMAAVLEVAKLVAASWLYRHWRVASLSMKSYLITAVMVLMLITSMGIFGYLSKAHLEQQASLSGDNTLLIQDLERRIQREQQTISDTETVIQQLDSTVQTLIDYDRIRGPDGALAVRQSQKSERQQLDTVITDAYTNIEQLQQQLMPLRQQLVALEVELGPLKYVSELVYGDADSHTLDQAARLFIILLVLVFDPLAVMLVLAANQSLARHGIVLENQYREQHDEQPHGPEEEHLVQPDSEQYIIQLLDRIQHLEEQKQALADQAAQTQEVVRTVVETIEVPGPERIVEVPGPERIVEVPGPERMVEVPVEKVIYVPLGDPEADHTDNLDVAAEAWASSEFNQDGLSPEQIKSAFEENSRELKTRQGFWSIPLPRRDNR